MAYGENYNRALQELQELIRTCYKPMQDFKKHLYEGVFQNFYSSHRSMFEAMEYVYQQEKEPESWIRKLVSCVIGEAEADLKTCRFKGQRNQRLLDYNFLLSVYLVPAVLKYPAKISEPFADTLIASWNENFGTSIGKASFDDIDDGFHRKLCYITTAICESLGKGADCRELKLLKEYRDHYLNPPKRDMPLWKNITISHRRSSSGSTGRRIGIRSIGSCMRRICFHVSARSKSRIMMPAESSIRRWCWS